MGTERTAEPSPGQAEAGNYRKRHVTWNGLPITIETEPGMARRGVGPGGEPWSVTLQHPYGYIKGTKGSDGEQIDVYMGPEPRSPHVFVVDQVDPATSRFDEHKALIGFPDETTARTAYEAGFSDGSGQSRLGAITALTREQFKEWALSRTQRGPLTYNDTVRAAEGISRDIGLNTTPVEAEAAAHIQKVNNTDPTDAVITVVDHQALAALDAMVDSAKKDRLTDAWTAHPETEDQTGAGAAPAGEQSAEPQSAPAERTAAPRVEPGESERGSAVEPVAPSTVTRDDEPREPLIELGVLTTKGLAKISKKIPSMSDADRAAVRTRLDEAMTQMASNGRAIAEHCIETGGKFSVRKRRR